jgi:hypothetical protein
MNGGDVRMVERRERTRLALEARDTVRSGRHQVGQNLNRDVAPKIGVMRTIHFAHAARAEERYDFVWANAGAG